LVIFKTNQNNKPKTRMSRSIAVKTFISQVLGVECKTHPNHEQNAFWHLPSGTVEIAGDLQYQIHVTLLKPDGHADFLLQRRKWCRTIGERATGRVTYRDLNSEGQEWHTCLPEYGPLMLAAFLYMAKNDTAMLPRPLYQLASFRDAKFIEFAARFGLAPQTRTRDSSPVRTVRRTKLPILELCN
jgi:hypothetical protein